MAHNSEAFYKAKSLFNNFFSIAEVGAASTAMKTRLHRQLNRFIKEGKDQIRPEYKKIEEYWKPYTTVNTKYHQWYSSRNGIEDVRYIPDDIYYTKIDQYFNNRKYGWGVNDKNYYGLYFSDVKQPVTVTRKINGIYYNANYEMITKEQAIELCNQASKVIVKPADNSGSRGVDLLKNNDAESLKNAFEYSKSFSRTGESVVEEYIEGSEVSVETMSIDGECHVIQITDKITTGVPYFVEMGHSQPSMLSEKIKGEIAEVAKAANKALGISNGPSHTEIKVTKDGPKIEE